MEFDIVLHQVTILFFILAIGYIAGKFNIIDSFGTKKLSEVLLHISAPMLVLSSFFIEFSKERMINIIWVIGFSTLTFIIAIMISKFVFRRFNDSISLVLRFAAIFSNCGYMGIPLMRAVFGIEGAFYGSFYVVMFQVFVWSYGYLMFGAKVEKAMMIKRVLLNPAIIAIYIGMIVFLFGIPIPESIKGGIKAVGDMTMPLSMLIIGGVISTERLLTLFSDWKVYLASFVRLIFMPILAFLISKVAGIPSLPAAITVTALAMPIATNTTIFSEMFGRDSIFASKCVTVSHLLSIITAPVIISWVASYI
ncbi:MAG: AEC family transporter [Clostridiaceae bacterium]|nr:AEC family transporter [Clostridiaceae bacterium]